MTTITVGETYGIKKNDETKTEPRSGVQFPLDTKFNPFRVVVLHCTFISTDFIRGYCYSTRSGF
ncbi:MAG: hypothetical protein C0397_19545 [Odoribacter sp.]|nr:hypothetical protein [Odoribacter sp.]